MIAAATIAFAMLLAAAPAPAAPDPVSLEAGLAGRWQGTLGYRDYQSDKLQEIPMATRIEALPDNATIIRISSFDDGPKVGNVYITTATLFDSKAGTAASVTLRRGRPLEPQTEHVRVINHSDPAHWTITYEADGTDDDKPARLRTTQVRDGDLLTATKEVQPTGSTTWQFRNRSRLTRLP